jgi:hypothetical protein
MLEREIEMEIEIEIWGDLRKEGFGIDCELCRGVTVNAMS